MGNHAAICKSRRNYKKTCFFPSGIKRCISAVHVCHCLLKHSYLGFWFCFGVSSFSSSDSPDTKLSPLTSSPAGIKMRRMPLLQCVMTVGMVWNAAAIWLKGAPNRSEPYPDPKDCEDLKGYMIYCIIYHDVLFPSNLDHGSSVLDVCYCHFRTLPRFQNHQHW